MGALSPPGPSQSVGDYVVAEEHGLLLGDAGYWHQQQMERIVYRGIQVLIPPDAKRRKQCRVPAKAEARRASVSSCRLRV
jgi:hypothetical protein